MFSKAVHSEVDQSGKEEAFLQVCGAHPDVQSDIEDAPSSFEFMGAAWVQHWWIRAEAGT